MWELTYNAPIGHRVKKDVFSGVRISCCPNGVDYWFDYQTNTFQPRDNIKGSMSTHGMRSINSVKSFKKYLNKHCNHLKNFELMLCSLYYVNDNEGKFLYDYSVSAKWVQDFIKS